MLVLARKAADWQQDYVTYQVRQVNVVVGVSPTAHDLSFHDGRKQK
jgi:hypothetical protein